MPELAIYQDTRGAGQCRSCGACIEWAVVVKSGRRMPFEYPIVPVRTQRGLGDTRVIEFVDTESSKTHFELCPQAPAWRRPRT